MGPLYPEAEARREYGATPAGAVAEDRVRTIRVVPSASGRYDFFFVNPFLAYDTGLTADAANMEGATTIVRGWTVQVGDGDNAMNVTRQVRDGRAVPTGFLPLRSHLAPGIPPALVRVYQKGDLPTNQQGGHKDGHLNASEGFREMIYGEILHRNGILTSRSMATARIGGVRRDLPKDGNPEAGIVLRVGELPRLDDGNAAPYFNTLARNPPAWRHPLLVSGLGNLTPEQRAHMVATLNEGMMQDLWILHGSRTEDNRSEAVIDLGTLAALSEPNAGANTGGATNLWSERKRSKETSNSLYLDGFAFHQLRRFGLPDAVILEKFFEKRTERTPKGDVVYYRAKKTTLELVDGIFYIDDFVEPKPQARFNADTRYDFNLENRVVFNSRKILRALRSYVERETLSDADIDAIFAECRNELFANESGFGGRNGFLKNRMQEAVRKIHATLRHASGYVAENREAVSKRAEQFPVTQHLPGRHDVERMAEHWMANPREAGREFRDYVGKFDPPAAVPALHEHYGKAETLPPGAARDLFLTTIGARTVCNLDAFVD